jgi:hypothetical protein
MTSRETTEARALARGAEHKWREHHRGCPRCHRAVRSHRWDDLCRFGTGYRAAHLEAAAGLVRNRQLDKLPSPDQEALF